MERNAIISDCGLYRYYLSRRWADGGKVMVFIMLNPSTADADIDDPTIRKCIGFAQRNGCNAIEVVNLFAFRATKPTDMYVEDHPVGPDNYDHIRSTVQNPNAIVVCAWGANGSKTAQARVVTHMVRHWKIKLSCLSKTKHGEPGHPLMLPYTSQLQPF